MPIAELFQVRRAPEALVRLEVVEVGNIEYLMLVDSLRHVLLPYGSSRLPRFTNSSISASA